MLPYDSPDSMPHVAEPPTTPLPVPSIRSTAGTRLRPALAVLALAATFGAGVGVGRIDLAVPGATGASPDGSQAPVASPDPTTDEDDLALIREAWKAIQDNYVEADRLDDRKLAYAAIDGLTEAVGDTDHTTFMTPEERAARSSALSGSYVGIGAQVDTSAEGLPVIIGVFRDSPADRAGLRAGDVIVAVDGTSTVGQDLDAVVERVRGEAGTAVLLTIRTGDEPERDVRIVRADVKLEPVSWSMAAGTTTAVVRLEQFSSGAAPKLRSAIAEAKAAGADRLVLDLRGNPGGYVNEAVAVASEFLASGTVYVERDADGKEKSTPVTAGGTATDLPMVVLVDGASASAAEIVAGAIQDTGRAPIVGERTFGTGTVLGEFALSDGSALRIGTLEWLTPKGRVIWHEGIAPDVVVARPAEIDPVVPDDLRSMSAAEVAEIADPQLARALELVATGS
jgi:carboxyl-terminal processing protease